MLRHFAFLVARGKSMCSEPEEIKTNEKYIFGANMRPETERIRDMTGNFCSILRVRIRLHVVPETRNVLHVPLIFAMPTNGIYRGKTIAISIILSHISSGSQKFLREYKKVVIFRI